MRMRADAMQDVATYTAVAAAGKNTAIGGGGLALLGGMAASDFAALSGVAIALIGVLVQVYYKRKADARARRADERAEEVHQLRLAGKLPLPAADGTTEADDGD